MDAILDLIELLGKAGWWSTVKQCWCDLPDAGAGPAVCSAPPPR